MTSASSAAARRGVPDETALALVAAAIDRCFGPNAPLARWYAQLLLTDGIERGVIGPREADRIWRRHLFNCAALAPLIPARATVIDLGSGAGLPGIPVALARPDLSVTLLEPMARRVRFLQRCLATLELPQVSVLHARAQEATAAPAAIVIARAVAPLTALAELALPLCEPNGRLLALKGRSVAQESAELARHPDFQVQLLTVEDALGETAHVASVSRAERVAKRSRNARGRAGSPRSSAKGEP